jgi:hypothetical protein
MSASSGANLTSGTRTLFARAVRGSERVILPINDSALRADTPIPAFYCVHSITGAAGLRNSCRTAGSAHRSARSPIIT